jgi:hypothetical protein
MRCDLFSNMMEVVNVKDPYFMTRKDACNGQSILSMCINAHLNVTMLAYGLAIDSCNKNYKPKKT